MSEKMKGYSYALVIIAGILSGAAFSASKAEAVLTTITITPAAPSVAVGATAQFMANGFDELGNPASVAVAWTTSDPTVGTIDPTSGLFTAVAPGTVTVNATNGVITGSATVTVYTPTLTTIDVGPGSPSVVAGATLQMTASTLDQFGNPISATVAWTSSDPAVGTIDAVSGLFTAVAPGTVNATATSGTVAGSTTVTVTAAPVLTTINVTPLNPTLAVGATQQFTAATLDQFGNPIAVAVTWSSSDPTIGTVDAASGLFTALAPGTATVTATSGVITGTSAATVSAPVLTTINVTPTNPTLAIGATQQFTAATLDQFDNPITATVTWTTSDPAIGTIDASTGLFTAVAPGTVTVTATSGTITGTAAATVSSPVLTAINVTPAAPGLAVGSTQQFTADTLDQFGSPIAVAVTWSTSDPAVGTIDANTGLFTAIAAGTTTVTATSGAITGSAVVTVATLTLTTINVTPASPTVVVGNTQQFTASTLDQFGNPISATVAWSSSDPAVGTIDANSGLFTAIAAGATTVTATSGAVTGTATVTVSTVAPPPVVNPTSSSSEEDNDHEENLPNKPTIKKKFEATTTSLTFPVQFERLANKRVVVTAEVQDFATGKTFEKVIKTKLGHDKGRKTITVDGLKHSTTYKIKVKIRKTGSKTRAHFSRSRKAATLN